MVGEAGDVVGERRELVGVVVGREKSAGDRDETLRGSHDRLDLTAVEVTGRRRRNRRKVWNNGFSNGIKT